MGLNDWLVYLNTPLFTPYHQYRVTDIELSKITTFKESTTRSLSGYPFQKALFADVIKKVQEMR